MLPPPARGAGDLGVLPTEMWTSLAFCLDPRSLCVASCASDTIGLALGADQEVWATLCSQHFPKMYTSVLLAQGACAPGVATSVGDGRGDRRTAAKRGGKGRKGRKGAVEDCCGAYGGAEAFASSPHGPPLAAWPQVEPLAWADAPQATAASGPAEEEELGSRTPSSSMSPGLQSVASSCSTAASPASPPMAVGGSDIDWKDLFAKRWARKREWNLAKRPIAAEAAPAAGEQGEAQRRFSDLSARELGRLSDAAHRIKICTFCGGKYSPGEARREPMGCCFHSGVFAPADPAGWSRADLKQLHQHARQALKNAGGASWVQRHPRASRGHGHWTKGLGVFSTDKARFRSCLEGQTAAVWSCCGAGSLFAEGCRRGMHRHF